MMVQVAVLYKNYDIAKKFLIETLQVDPFWEQKRCGQKDNIIYVLVSDDGVNDIRSLRFIAYIKSPCYWTLEDVIKTCVRQP